MSFDLKIKLPKGFEPPVRAVEMPPLKRDPDRTPDEDLQWQLQRYERARQRAQEEAWAPFARTIPTRSMGVITAVLGRAGALFRGDSSLGRSKRTIGRGPNGEVDERKFASNDGWLVTPEECAFIAGRLKGWLDSGGESFERGGVAWNLTPSATDQDDQKARTFLFEIAEFFLRASQHGGLEVW